MRRALTPQIKKALEDQINTWSNLRAALGSEDKDLYNRYSHYITGFASALGIMNIPVIYKNDTWIVAEHAVKDDADHLVIESN